MKKGSRIFIAGHQGLVGSAILRNLQNDGYTHLITRTHSELDLVNTVEVDKFFNDYKPEYVLLAAAKVGGIAANNTYRADFIYENLMIQNNVIHQSYLNGVKKLLFLGSTCIYPKNSPQPLKEDYLLTDLLEHTNEPYAIAKIAGIKMCESYNLQYGTNFISAMPTNLYGYNDNFDLENAHVLPALLRKIHLGKALENNDWDSIFNDLNKLPIHGINGKASKKEIELILEQFGIVKSVQSVIVEIWGTGRPKREFLWVDDMAKACIFLMKNYNIRVDKNSNSEIRNTHLNIGTGEDISIADLATTIKSIIGFQGDFKYNSEKPDGTPRKLVDVTKINRLGWQSETSLNLGIEKMYNWYLNN